MADLVDRYISWRLHTPALPVYVFVLERISDGRVIGEGTLRFDQGTRLVRADRSEAEPLQEDPAEGVGDLGYWLGAAFHGAGHGRDAVELLVQAGFLHCGAAGLTAQIMGGNERSLAALRRAGFHLEPRSEAALPPDLAPGQRPIAWQASLGRAKWDRGTTTAG